MNENHLYSVAKDLLNCFKQSDFKGYDPFDGLNSKLFQFMPFIKNSSFAQLAWIQFHKRSPINFRKLCLVPKSKNPKGISLIILGLVNLYKATKDKSYLEISLELANWLINQNFSIKTDEYGCGYNFPWRARAFFVEKNTPNIIVTTYIAMAFYELYLITKQEKYLDLNIRAARYIYNNLFNNNKGYFHYIPGKEVLVHNANLWGVATVARAASIINNIDWLNSCNLAANLSIKAQATDGSWVYGEREHHNFIDGFHTGYNIEALDIYFKVIEKKDKLTLSCIKKGLDYYKQNFFLKNGALKYYNNKIYPIDAHSISQAIITLTKLDKNNSKNTIEKSIRYSLENLYCVKKSKFYYQKNYLFTNKANYLRWTQAWMFYSLSFYLANMEIGCANY